jgi:hypothetical protein
VEKEMKLLELGLCETVVTYELGTVAAMVDYIIERIYGGDRTKSLEVFQDIRKIISQQYNINEEEVKPDIKIKNLA